MYQQDSEADATWPAATEYHHPEMALPERESGASPGTVSIVLLAGLWGSATCALTALRSFDRLLLDGSWDASDRYVAAFFLVSLVFFLGLIGLGRSLRRSCAEQRWLGPSLGVCTLLLALWLPGGDIAGLLLFGPPLMLLAAAVVST